MQKIDPAFLYNVGGLIRALTKIDEAADYYELAADIKNGRDAVLAAIHPNNIYTPSLKQAKPAGELLWAVLNSFIEKAENGDWDGYFTQEEVHAFQDSLFAFESAYLNELRNATIYYVKPKGGFDIEGLIDKGENLFPTSLATKVPEAIADVKEGARALAFRLWTAAGYHMHRANEAVLREYFDHVIEGAAVRDPKDTMGNLLQKMKSHQVGDKPVISALFNLVKLHRNPLAHPGDTIETQDEAFSLYAAIRAAMGYMLDRLPDPSSPPPVFMPTVAPTP